MSSLPFAVGKIYKKHRDIHNRYGGQQQGGISTPAGAPFVFLFTGDTGGQYGYADCWTEERVFLYTGEGQVGDMEFVRGNKAIRDHAADGKDLLLFEALGKGKGVRFLGSFSCSTWEPKSGTDKLGNLRKVIVFHLVPLDEVETISEVETKLPLEELRRRAYAASRDVAEKSATEARRAYYNCLLLTSCDIEPSLFDVPGGTLQSTKTLSYGSLILATTLISQIASGQTQATVQTSAKDPLAITLVAQSLANVGAVPGLIQDSTTSGTLTYPDGSSGNLNIETKGTSIRQQLDLPGKSLVSVVKGGQGYVQMNGTRVTLPPHIAKYSGPYYIPALSRMASSSQTNALVSYIGKESVNGISVHHIVLQFLPIDATPVEEEALLSEFHVFLDTESLTIVKTQSFHFSPVAIQNRSVCETYYADYRKVQGVLIPFHIREEVAGQPYSEITLTNVALNSGLSDVDFQ